MNELQFNLIEIKIDIVILVLVEVPCETFIQILLRSRSTFGLIEV